MWLARIERLGAKARDRWNESTETQRDLWKLAAWLAVIACVAGAGWATVRPWWRLWRHDRALEQAAAFERSGDNRDALLAMRNALALAPRDRATHEAAADFLSRIGSPEAVDLREQVAGMAPDDEGARLALAAEALRFGETLRAEAALRTVREKDRGIAYHRLAARLASALGQTAEAKAQLAAVLTGDPQDTESRLEFADLLTRSSDAREKAAGKAGLDALLGVPSARVRAAIALLKAVAREHDAQELAQQVEGLRTTLAGVPATPGQTADDSWSSLVELLKPEARTPDDVALLARWLGFLGQRREMLVWIESLPGALRDAAEVRKVSAELSAELNDLPRLRELLLKGAWGDVTEAALAPVLASRETGRAVEGAVWDEAAAACGSSAEGLRVLIRLASVWHDDDGEERLLKASLERFPWDRRWTYEQLRLLYGREKNAGRLLQLYEDWARMSPEDAGVAASWVTLSAVLKPGDARTEARARALYATGPLVPASAVAQAAVWWRQGRQAAALRILQMLPAEEARKPAVSFWLGVIEADMGQQQEARVSLNRADPTIMLTEEQELWRAAAAKAGTGVLDKQP